MFLNINIISDEASINAIVELVILKKIVFSA